MSSPFSIDARARRGFDAVFAGIEAEAKRRELERQRIIDRLRGNPA